MPQVFPLLALLVWAALPVQAQTLVKDFGVFNAPASLDLVNSAPAYQALEHWLQFTVADGTHLSFSAVVSAGGGRSSGSNDLDARLLKGGALIQDGWDRTIQPDPGVPVFPTRLITFSSQTLSAGEYTLEVTGTVFGRWPEAPYGTYRGTLELLSVAGPVPEPAAGLLFALGALGVGARLRQRRNALGRLTATPDA